MSNYFLNTENIDIFPSTRRSNKQISARLVTEKSVTSIINKLIDTDGFVITLDNEDGSVPTAVPFEFNIHGYYFSVASVNNILDLFTGYNANVGDKIYANISLEISDSYKELSGQDEDVNDQWIYKGIEFSLNNPTSAEVGYEHHDLLLLVYDGTDWQVPVESRVKFEYNFALGVDGGEI